ncbi:chromogranin-A [Poecilia formosa]|uniref:Chromogranin-A n=1 Tax=Poecilia formosa TaxID=48698 RepID=A0A087Y3C8_POEFO|nr:PREDICTED: chromogranin-A [Poecilia formosa]
MIGSGLLLLTILSNRVLSLPVTSSQLENEDVEVMKCIVEALADVLSRPKQVPVSQECLNTLKTNEKLLTILRHHNFLKELQEIAAQGDHEKGRLQKYKEKPTPATQVLQTTADGADRSMLEALGGPGERSILSQKKRSGEQRDGTEEESPEDVKRDEDEAERDEDRTSSEENSEEDDERGDRSNKREDPKQKTAGAESEERSDKRSALFSRKHDGKEETEEQTAVKRGSRESLRHLTQRARSWQQKKKAGGEEEPLSGSRQEVSHHSREEAEEGKQKKKRDPERTPEERELQMIARRSPEERKVMEEEGSGTRRSEEPEIESLAAIESELENVAQKIHELRRG